MKKKLTQKQRRLVENMAKGMPQGQAAIEAGYAPKYACQAAYQVLESIRKLMPEVLDRMGLTDEALIEKQLRPLLEATETKFFPYQKTIRRKIDGRKCTEKVQVIETREVVAWKPRLRGLDMAFKLKGSYPPRRRESPPDENFQFGVVDASHPVAFFKPGQ